MDEEEKKLARQRIQKSRVQRIADGVRKGLTHMGAGLLNRIPRLSLDEERKPKSLRKKKNYCHYCGCDLDREPYPKYAIMRSIYWDVNCCVSCWKKSKDARKDRRSANQFYYPKGQFTQGDNNNMTTRNEFPIPAIKEEDKMRQRPTLSKKVSKAKAKDEKEARKRDLKGVQFVLVRLKNELEDLDLSSEEIKEIKELASANRAYLREGKFDRATIAQIAKAYRECHREGINWVIDHLRPPSRLNIDVGFGALKQALQLVPNATAPPPPPHPDFSLPDSHPDKKSREGLAWWSKTKPRYEPNKDEVLSMNTQAVKARVAEQHRVEHPPKKPLLGRQSVHNDSAVKRGVAGQNRPSGG